MHATCLLSLILCVGSQDGPPLLEDRPLGSGRAVKEAARFAGATDTLVVCNGDILTNVDLSAMIELHRSPRN